MDFYCTCLKTTRNAEMNCCNNWTVQRLVLRRKSISFTLVINGVFRFCAYHFRQIVLIILIILIGYGFVDFASPEDAQSVLDALARGEQVCFQIFWILKSLKDITRGNTTNQVILAVS